MGITNLIAELKEEQQDFEYYPTTEEMFRAIYGDIMNLDNITARFCNRPKYPHESELLDIGAGEGNLFKTFEKIHKEKYTGSPSTFKNANPIKKYYVIEKSDILRQRQPHQAIPLGCDFNSTLLLDKKVNYVFCNPPYKEFEEWTARIIEESFCEFIYLVIPQRWVNSELINNALRVNNLTTEVIFTGSFEDAERRARANVDIVRVDKKRFSYSRDDDKVENGYNEEAFSKWFDSVFPFQEAEDIDFKQYEGEEDSSVVETGNKAQMLVNLYNAELDKTLSSLQTICKIDLGVLESINVTKESIKEAVKSKAINLKTVYWNRVFNELEALTDKLTSDTRKTMFHDLKYLDKIDFTLENIESVIMHVAKNANKMYGQQLVNLFDKLTTPESIEKYKSNQKVFKLNKWDKNRFDYDSKHEVTHLVLIHRIVCTDLFKVKDWSGNSLNHYENHSVIDDIVVIARNLGFTIDWEKGSIDRLVKSGEIDFGKNYDVKFADSKTPFMTFKIYKNGNTHVKFNLEFMKAFNVEVARLRGWIRLPEDIKKEFPKEMAEGAEKYFEVSDILKVGGNTTKLLGKLF